MTPAAALVIVMVAAPTEVIVPNQSDTSAGVAELESTTLTHVATPPPLTAVT